MAKAKKSPLTQREMIREAFEELGYHAVPGRVAPWIKDKFGKEVKTQTISVEKTWMKREHDWIVEAFQKLGEDANPTQVQEWLKSEKGQEWSTEYVGQYISGIQRRKTMLAAAAEADPKRRSQMQENKAEMVACEAIESAKSSQIAIDALALLKRVKLFADEIGGVERLRDILDMLR